MSRAELYFTAYGTPRPQGSKRHVGNGRLIEASDVKPWRLAIARAVEATFVATEDDSQFTEPVVVYATFFLPKPKTVQRVLPSVAPDLDKLCRALGDALSVESPAAMSDDSLIVEWHAKKRYAVPGKEGVRVEIRLAAEVRKERDEAIAAS